MLHSVIDPATLTLSALCERYRHYALTIRNICEDTVNERIHFRAAKGGYPIEQHLTLKAGNRLTDYIVNGRPSLRCPKSS